MAYRRSSSRTSVTPLPELPRQSLAAPSGPKEPLSFDPKAYKRDVLPESGISDRVVAALQKEKSSRTKEDLSAIYSLIINLPGLFPKQFSSFPQYIKKDLAKILSFEQRDKGDVVVQQGEKGYTFYVIVFGTAYVAVESEEVDPESGMTAPCNRIVATLKAGKSFGEIALLSEDSLRRATVVCKEYCQLVTISKADFDRVVRGHYEQEIKTKKKYFAQHSLFQNWTDEQLDLLAKTSDTEEFGPDAVIQQGLNQGSDGAGYVSFIQKGRCKVVQPVQSVSHTQPDDDKPRRSGSWGGSTYSSAVFSPSKQRWWHLRTLEAGDYFGVGEGDSTMSVLADLMVECIKVQAVTLHKLEKGKIERLRQLASRYYPTLEQRRILYRENVQWTQYKMAEVSRVAQMNRKPHSTKLRDVPGVLVSNYTYVCFLYTCIYIWTHISSMYELQ